ncbi:motility associated factor glycosyltransferase family protein [Clostridium neonatale]|uniref:motility associated factor glycosyltransferase family protein n=1 Tax=Clostridium neonatale TaxID=137838 RepID=UPI003D325010
MHEDYKIELSKDGYEILKVKNNSKWIYIGSKYNMKSEIDKFINEFDVEQDKNSIFLIYGFASGVHIKTLRKKFKNNKIIVYEPNEKLKEYVYNKKWVLEDKNLIVLFCKKDEIKDYLLNYIEEYDLDNIKFVYLHNYLIYMDDLKESLEFIKNFLSTLRINRNTKMFFNKRWFETIIGNIPGFINGSPIDLYKDKYKNKAAIIVSAGPSLEKNIDELKNIDNDIMIISGGRTLKPLIEKEIKPHLLVVADPGEISYELVEGYMENLDIPLLFYEGTNEKVVSHHKGDKIFFSTNKFIDDICEKDIIQLSQGGSVSHSMTSAALVFGCNPIIFVGQDLAFSGERRYSSLTRNRDGSDPSNSNENDGYMVVEGVNEKEVRTNGEFEYFRRSFESIIKENPDIVFINATEGGARIHGAKEMKLKDAISKYKSSKIEKLKKIKYDIDLKGNAVQALKKVEESAKNIINSSKEAISELKKMEKMNDTNKVNECLIRLNKIDEKIKKESKNIELVRSLIYPIIYETLNQRHKIINLNNKEDKVRSIIYENMKLYNAFIEQLQFALNYIDETVITLEK